MFDYEVHLENNYPIRSVALHDHRDHQIRLARTESLLDQRGRVVESRPDLGARAGAIDAEHLELVDTDPVRLAAGRFHDDPGNVPPTLQKQAEVAVLGRRYLDVAPSRPAVVAVMPFVGPHQVHGADIFFGVFEMPPVHDIYRRFGETMNLR